MSENNPRKDRSGLLFLIFTLLGSIGSLAIAIGLVVWSFRMQSDAGTEQALLSAGMALAFGLMFLIGLPGVFWAWRDLRRTPASAGRPKPLWSLALVLVPVGVCLGIVSASQTPASSILNSAAYVLTICGAILALVLLMRWMGPPISPRRAWGHFLIGLWGMPVIAMIAEVMLFITFLVLLGLGLLISPDGLTLLEMSPLAARDSQILYEIIDTLSMTPWVIGLVFVYLALLVPLLEEAIKTISVWPVLRRKITPAQAFLGGALAGAGFALFEALSAAEPGVTWMGLAVGRSGTTLMHVFTAAITNWAIVRSVRDRKWGISVLAYAGAACLHGIWNATALGVSLAGPLIASQQTGSYGGFETLINCAGVLVLMALSCLALVALPWIARKLSQAESAAP